MEKGDGSADTFSIQAEGYSVNFNIDESWGQRLDIDVPQYYQLTLDAEGAGTVEIDDNEITESPYEQEYMDGDKVELKAVPDDGWKFVEWTGDETGTDTTLEITMDTDKTMTANFEEEESEDTTPPTADAGVDKTVEVGEQFTLNASDSSDNVDIVSYEWDLDNGDNKTGEKITYTYEGPGNYTVELAVTDEADNNDTDTVEITVEEPDEGDDDGGDNSSSGTPGFTSLLLLTAAIIAVAIYRRRW